MLGRALAAAAAAVSFSAVSPAIAGPVTITYSDWHLAEPVWNRSLKEAITEFEKLNPDIKVNLEAVALGQRDVRYATAFRAGRGPDVFSLDVNPVKQFIQQGWLMDLTKFAAREGGGQWAEDFYPRTLDVVRERNHIYAIPKCVVPMVLYYNSVMFKDAGIAHPPRTWTEFRADAKKLTKASKAGGPIDQWGTTIVMMPAGFDLRFSVFLRGFGGDMLTPDNKHSALDTPAAKEAFNYVLDLILVDKTMTPGVSTVDAHGARQHLATKRVGMAFESAWAHPIIADLNPALDAWKVLKISPVPQKEGAKGGIRSTLHLKSLAINPNTKYPEESWKLVKFLTDPPRMQKWYVDNNLLSARKSVNATYDRIQKDPNARLMAQELEHAAFMPLIPQWPEINEAFRQNLQAAVAGIKSREQALGDAHKQIEAILARAAQ
jgi:ABC-type glycerol-3-phosphate transport system substrate-binding protein